MMSTLTENVDAIQLQNQLLKHKHQSAKSHGDGEALRDEFNPRSINPAKKDAPVPKETVVTLPGGYPTPPSVDSQLEEAAKEA